MPKAKIVNNNQPIININIDTGKTPASKKATSRNKQLAKTKKLGKPAKKDTIDKPADLDLQNVIHHAPLCPATYYVCAAWSHEPMAKFERRTRLGRNDGKPAKLYHDVIRFNNEAFRRSGFLRPGMQLAVYVDDLDAPKYVLFQNVVRTFEAPLHFWKTGTYSVIDKQTHSRPHVCNPESKTFAGLIGHDKWHPYPMPLLARFPWLHDNLLRLWRVADQPDILLGRLADRIEVPYEIIDKMTRTGRMVESDHRPIISAEDTLAAMPNTN